MAIGVFIASILLYWEALSSESQDKATFSAAQRQTPLPNPAISAVGAVGRFDQERVGSDFQQLVLIGRAGRDAAKNVAGVSIKKRIPPNTPSARKIRNDLRALSDLTRKRSVAFEGIVAALGRVSVSPMAHEFRTAPLFDAGASEERHQQKSDEDGFHLERCGGRLTRGRHERNRLNTAKAPRATPAAGSLSYFRLLQNQF